MDTLSPPRGLCLTVCNKKSISFSSAKTAILVWKKELMNTETSFLPRNSLMEFGEVYFWTSTIHQWSHLLKSDEIKDLIISSLSFLTLRKKIKVYGFVLMPNHIHLLWELLEMNGKEMPHASFQKFTAHTFQKYLQLNLPNELIKYQVTEGERSHRYWQRDPLAIRVFNRKMFEQKLNYIHNNPLQPHWGLAVSPIDYNYSSAAFYETGDRKFDFLTHYLDQF